MVPVERKVVEPVWNRVGILLQQDKGNLMLGLQSL
jgi:hypothetical protein